MNSTLSPNRIPLRGTTVSSRIAGAPALTIPMYSRTELPVVSNRAFVASWMLRRNRLAAAARTVRAN